MIDIKARITHKFFSGSVLVYEITRNVQELLLAIR
jgi:hypothetical protein